MLYLRVCQHFHNKPLFSGCLDSARKTDTQAGTQRERQPSKTYMLGSLIQGLYFESKSLCVSVAATHSSSFAWWCQRCVWHSCPLPSRIQLENSGNWIRQHSGWLASSSSRPQPIAKLHLSLKRRREGKKGPCCYRVFFPNTLVNLGIR